MANRRGGHDVPHLSGLILSAVSDLRSYGRSPGVSMTKVASGKSGRQTIGIEPSLSKLEWVKGLDASSERSDLGKRSEDRPWYACARDVARFAFRNVVMDGKVLSTSFRRTKFQIAVR